MFASPTRSALISGLLHGGAILLILAVTGVKTQIVRSIHEVLTIPLDLQEYELAAHAKDGGGGGGRHADSPASLGRPAPFARRQIVVPTVLIPDTPPILPMEPTLIGDPEIKLANFDYQQYGDPHGVPGKPSAGPGDGGGIGPGHGPGIGPGDGPGLGPGHDGGLGGAVEYTGAKGGGVTPPTLLWKSEPEYSEDARKARLQGTVVLRIEVNPRGQAQNVSIRQSLGLGLDERAMDAVKRWKFNPGKVNGRPATVVAYVEVNFRLL